jgi:drug/metabolite transporter (DMT)-like permease
MIWLALSIATSSFLYVIFKYFQIFEVNRLHAIVINYAVACVTGMVAYQGEIDLSDILNAAWLPYAVVLGFLFITVFNVMALTSQKNGLSVAAVSSKMSLVIPVLAGFWLYEESFGWIKIVGILLALASVVLTSARSKNKLLANQGYLFLPLLLFAGSGIIDTVLKYAETTHVPDGDEPLFSAVCFLVSFVIGILVLIYEAKQRRYVNGKSVVAGMLLGIPNYFSIYFIIKALKTNMESSVVYPINHVGTVLLTSILGIILFKEKMILKNYIGIVIAMAAIVMVAFAKA